MLYDEFIGKTKKAGVPTGLPPYFELIDDETVYPPSELAEIIGVCPETVRAYCREHKMKTVGVSHYKIPGIEAKRYLFKKVFKRIPKNIRAVL